MSGEYSYNAGVLSELAYFGGVRGFTATQLRRRAGLTRLKVSRALEALVRRGFVRRVPTGAYVATAAGKAAAFRG